VKCPACSEETAPARFCGHCGQPLPAPAEERAEAGAEPPPPRPRKAAEKVAEAIEAYRRHGAPLLEVAKESGAKGLLSASLAKLTTAALKEHPDLMKAALEGTVTIAFSDIEGSTVANERLGDRRWLEVLRTHNGIVREQLATHGGCEVKNLGDGFMLAFSSARKGVQCAVAVQQAFAAHGEVNSEEAIAVRIGLHTGEVTKEEGDFFGADVALAARVAGAARGGQILVSDLVKELVESSGEFEFGRAKKTSLKGIGSQVVYEVLWKP
jgi:class 3 adenylate cyclase